MDVAFASALWQDGIHADVSEEPGIGKSRLELATDLGCRPHAWLPCRGSARHQHTPFQDSLVMQSIFVMGVALIAGVLSLPRPALADWVLEEVQSFPSSRVELTVGTDGNVYGTAIAEPAGSSSGSIFRIDAAGGFSTLHSFTNDSASRLVVGEDGALYGTTCEGCAAYYTYATSGVFRIDHAGNYTPLVTLPIWAASSLVLGSDGGLYGALGYDDCTVGDCVYGNLYKVTGEGTLTVFPGRRAGAVPSVVGSDGAIYGGIPDQTSPGIHGFVFRLSTAGSYSAIHTFVTAEGFGADYALGADGLVYGSSVANDAGGAVFRFGPTGAFTLLNSFDFVNEGMRPHAPPTLGSDGAMYGVTPYGGPGHGGTVFRVDSAGTFTVLAALDWYHGVNQPLGMARNGRLYATAANDRLIEVSSPATVASYPFAPSLRDRGYLYDDPLEALVQGNDCALYGSYRDVNSEAVVFRLFEPGIPCPTLAATVPSLSSAGFAALAVLMLSAGGRVLRRRSGGLLYATTRTRADQAPDWPRPASGEPGATVTTS